MFPNTNNNSFNNNSNPLNNNQPGNFQYNFNNILENNNQFTNNLPQNFLNNQFIIPRNDPNENNQNQNFNNLGYNNYNNVPPNTYNNNLNTSLQNFNNNSIPTGQNNNQIPFGMMNMGMQGNPENNFTGLNNFNNPNSNQNNSNIQYDMNNLSSLSNPNRNNFNINNPNMNFMNNPMFYNTMRNNPDFISKVLEMQNTQNEEEFKMRQEDEQLKLLQEENDLTKLAEQMKDYLKVNKNIAYIKQELFDIRRSEYFNERDRFFFEELIQQPLKTKGILGMGNINIDKNILFNDKSRGKFILNNSEETEYFDKLSKDGIYLDYVKKKVYSYNIQKIEQRLIREVRNNIFYSVGEI